jgi:pyruvate/2-oxoglutarate/acetoin dehydrogenase E1 component
MTTVLQKLNCALLRSMQLDDRIHLLGEDILDPYGGAFKVTRGLSTLFPGRVLTTPISEAAIIGIATGMAMRGLRPVVEIMFGDFVTLIADQIMNHAAKFRWVYHDKVSVPMVIRTPMGGRRGYGPTHSQSLEKLFLGVPGMRVVAPNTLGDPAEMLQAAIADDDPVLFVEHKLLYPCHILEVGLGDIIDAEVEKVGDRYPTYRIGFSTKPHLSIATYGYNFELVRQAAIELLYEREIFSEIILFSQLSPFDVSPLVESLSRTHRLLTVEEGVVSLGWGSEVASRVIESGLSNLKVRRIGAMDFPIANTKPLEDIILPSQLVIKQAIIELVNL